MNSQTFDRIQSLINKHKKNEEPSSEFSVQVEIFSNENFTHSGFGGAIAACTVEVKIFLESKKIEFNFSSETDTDSIIPWLQSNKEYHFEGSGQLESLVEDYTKNQNDKNKKRLIDYPLSHDKVLEHDSYCEFVKEKLKENKAEYGTSFLNCTQIEKAKEVVRSKERVKETGEVFTPIELVDEILSKIPIEVWQDKTKTFVDNSCGDGNFLVRVLDWKIEHGSTVEEALSTIYGVDIMPDNIEVCKERLLSLADSYDKSIFGMAKAKEKYGHIVDKNIVCADALTYNYSFGE